MVMTLRVISSVTEVCSSAAVAICRDISEMTPALWAISSRALEARSTSATLRRNVALLSHQEGLSALSAKNYDSAITHLDRARTTNGLNTVYRLDLARAYDARGQLRRSLGDLDDAIDDFKKGFALDPSNTSLDANLSSALAQNGGS